MDRKHFKHFSFWIMMAINPHPASQPSRLSDHKIVFGVNKCIKMRSSSYIQKYFFNSFLLITCADPTQIQFLVESERIFI